MLARSSSARSSAWARAIDRLGHAAGGHGCRRDGRRPAGEIDALAECRPRRRRGRRRPPARPALPSASRSRRAAARRLPVSAAGWRMPTVLDPQHRPGPRPRWRRRGAGEGALALAGRARHGRRLAITAHGATTSRRPSASITAASSSSCRRPATASRSAAPVTSMRSCATAARPSAWWVAARPRVACDAHQAGPLAALLADVAALDVAGEDDPGVARQLRPLMHVAERPVIVALRAAARPPCTARSRRARSTRRRCAAGRC